MQFDKKGSDYYEYIVVGTGAGGGPVARRLARAGKKVLMVEKGLYEKHLLGIPGGARMMEKFAIFARSMDGCIIERGQTIGGSTMVYSANVFDPPKRFIENMGIDFVQECEEVKKEANAKPLPDSFFEKANGTNKLCESAEELGMKFEKQAKFIDPDKCKAGCDECMFGCRRDAKFTTRIHVEEALAYGADLIYGNKVETLLFNENRSRVLGVKLKNGTIIRGENVILAGGGIGTPALLQRSGIAHLGSQEVGTHFFMDPMNVLLGINKDSAYGMLGETTFTHAITEFEESEGFILGNAGALATWIVMFNSLPTFKKAWWRGIQLPKAMGMFVKIGDSAQGQIYPNEKTRKPMNDEDNRKVMRGTDVCKDIMINAGCDPKSFSLLRWCGGHPGGTVAMGKAVDHDFSTEIQGLYVCDGSIMPDSPGAPPALSLMAMSELCGKFMLGEVKVEDRLIKAAEDVA